MIILFIDLYESFFNFLLSDVGFAYSPFGEFLCEILTTVAICLIVFLPFFVVYKLIKTFMEWEY